MAEFVSIKKPVINTDFGFIPLLRAWSSKDGLSRFCRLLFVRASCFAGVSAILCGLWAMGFLRPGSPLYGALRGSILAVIA